MARWFYSQYGQQHGPFEASVLAGMLAAGTIKPTDMVWHEGMTSWAHAGAMPELNPAPVSSAAEQNPPPMPPPVANNPPPAHVPQYYSQPYPAYAPAPQSGLGVASFIIGMLVIVIELASIGGATALAMNRSSQVSTRTTAGSRVTVVRSSRNSHEPGFVAAGLGMFLGIFLALIGAILGITSLFQPRQRTYAILGLIFNGGVIAITMGIVLVSMRR